MAKRGTTTKRQALENVPQSLEEATEAVARIGDLKREINRKTADAEEKITRIQEELGKEVTPLTEEIETVLDGIHAYAESNRKALTKDGKTKTVKLTTGTMGWHKTPWKVNIRKTEDVIDALKKLRLERFIRTIEEVDKEAMLREPKVAQGVSGVSITQTEEFIVKPNKIEVDIKKKISTTKKTSS